MTKGRKEIANMTEIMNDEILLTKEGYDNIVQGA